MGPYQARRPAASASGHGSRVGGIRLACADAFTRKPRAHDRVVQRQLSVNMISLGISYTEMHDSSAAIGRDGELLFGVAEERLSYKGKKVRDNIPQLRRHPSPS